MKEDVIALKDNGRIWPQKRIIHVTPSTYKYCPLLSLE